MEHNGRETLLIESSLKYPRYSKPHFFIILYKPSVFTDSIHLNVFFIIFTCVQLRPFYDLIGKMIPTTIWIDSDAVDIDGGIEKKRFC